MEHGKLGDVLVTYSEGELTNFLIQGEFKHAALFLGTLSGHVVESIGSGVTVTRLDDFVKRKDKIAICRPSFASQEEKIEACNWAENQLGMPYDFKFQASTDAFYCAELITAAYTRALMKSGKTSPFRYRKIMGEYTILPQDFVDAKEKFSVISRLPSED
jgi:uncharacterized protein YycO